MLDFIETFNLKTDAKGGSLHTYRFMYVVSEHMQNEIVQNDKNYVNFVVIYRCEPGRRLGFMCPDLWLLRLAQDVHSNFGQI